MRSGSITSSTDRKGVGKRVTPRRGLIAALDVGTAKICCFISRIEDDGTLEVVGIGHQVAQGTRCLLYTSDAADE